MGSADILISINSEHDEHRYLLRHLNRFLPLWYSDAFWELLA